MLAFDCWPELSLLILNWMVNLINCFLNGTPYWQGTCRKSD